MALSVNRVVNVTVNLSPMAAQKRGFGTLCILGQSAVLSASESYRAYTSYDDVAEDFGASAPETLCAQAYFAQSPKPTSLVVAQWRTTPSAAVFTGGRIKADNFSQLQVEHGGFSMNVDGAAVNVDVDTRNAKNLSEFVTILAAAVTTADVKLVNEHLVITSKTTGEQSKIGFATAPAEGVTDFSEVLGITEAAGASTVAGKAAAETLVEAVSRLITTVGRDFYGLVLALEDDASDDDLLSIAQIIEAAEDSHIFGITTSDREIASTVYSEESTDLPSKLKRGQYTRTITFYADYVAGDAAYQLNKYFAASALGRMFTVNFEGTKTMITLKFKQAPSLQPSDLTPPEATNFEARNVNVYATYDNGTYIIEQGVMASGQHADERHGLDWLQNAIQTELFNLFYQSQSVPQTLDGVNQEQATIEKVLQQAGQDGNGLIAPGQWNGNDFGALKEGDYLANGYYIYATDINDQAQSDREKRKSPPFKIAVKLAGAIESADVEITVNR